MAVYGVTPYFPWDPAEPIPDDAYNPYGMWDERWNLNDGGKSEEPNCRLTQPIYVCSLCGDKTPEDPTGFLRYFVIFNHFLAFIAPVCMLWTICGRFDSLRKRIYSPFLLMSSTAIWEAASMAEYAGHQFAMNWNSCFDTADHIMKIYFYWFTCIGLAAVTIGSRPKDFPFWRKPVDVGDWTSFLLDWIMILSSTSIIPLYLILDKPLGKNTALNLMVFSSAFSSIVIIYRIWKNMGPTTNLLIMATLSTASSLAGAATNNIFLSEGNQLWHALMGFLFGGQQFVLAICFYLVVDPDGDKNHVKGNDVTGEQTSLI